MRSILLGGLAALVFVASAHAAPQDVPATIDTSWRVTLAADGSVTSLAQQSEVKPALADPLEAAIRGWTFEPGKLDGVPAVTETTLSVAVGLEPEGDGYVARVEDVRTGGRIGKMTAPEYPRNQLRKNVAAQVILKVQYDATGEVTTVESAPGSPTVARDFTISAIKAVRRWQFEPERVGGHGIAATVQVPICFSLSVNNAPPPKCEPWTPAGAHAATDGAVTDDPAARVKVDVVGRKL